MRIRHDNLNIPLYGAIVFHCVHWRKNCKDTGRRQSGSVSGIAIESYGSEILIMAIMKIEDITVIKDLKVTPIIKDIEK
jgi:hypothetical protein